MAVEAGKWEMISSENYGDYLKAAGLGMIARNLADKQKPTEELTVSGDTWKLSVLTALKNAEVSFKVGEPVEVEQVEGRTTTSTFSTDNYSLLTEVQECVGAEQSTVVRAYSSSDMKVTYTCQGVTATRFFKKL